MRHGRRDANHAEIRDGLRALAKHVSSLSVTDCADLGNGFPDLLVAYRGQTYLLEIKVPGAKLTPAEHAFRASWRGHYAVVHSLDEAVRELGMVTSTGDWLPR